MRHQRFAVVVAAALLASVLGGPATAGPRPTDLVDLSFPPRAASHTGLDGSLDALQRTPEPVRRGQTDAAGYDPASDLVAVEIRPAPGRTTDVERLLAAHGVDESLTLPEVIVARVPVAALAALARAPEVAWIGSSAVPIADATGQGVAAIGAVPWHAEGLTGAGIKIAIIDLGFAGFESRLGGELPSRVHTYDRCGDMGAPEDHGTVVAEVVHEVAPHATLYLMCIGNPLDLGFAVDHAIAQGVTVINHSVGWFNAGRGDGSGPIGSIAAKAREAGILWVNSAGNQRLAHAGGMFEDTDADGWHEFAAGPDETIEFTLDHGRRVDVFLRWDEWPTAATNLDLYLFLNPPNAGNLVALSAGSQTGLQPPFESLFYTNTSGFPQTLHLAVQRSAGTGAPDMDIYVLGAPQPIAHNMTARSLPDPATSPIVLSVGATRVDNGLIEVFSSRGPTITGQVKPDLSAPNRVSTSFGPFAGTSAAAPHTAGAAALVQAAHQVCSPTLLHLMLIERTDGAGGPPIPNNDYGHGRLLLDAPPPPTEPVLRYAGGNRYATAAAISKGDFPCGSRTVLIATGENFPDALAVAAAAGRFSAPILLVQQDSIPADTLIELQRLDPDRIVVVGGTAAVSTTVLTQLGSYGTVARLAGSNRFATAREISQSAYPDPSAVADVFLANGFGFADALAGGPTAAHRGGPLLLVHADSVPNETLLELGRLDPQRVWVLGGPAVVSDAVIDNLTALGYTVNRVSGADRYATAVEASKSASRSATFETAGVISHRVYIAVGTNFPDALAGAGVAGIRHAPVLLVQSNSIPQAVIDEIKRLNPRQIVILGGLGVVSTAVENQLRALLD